MASPFGYTYANSGIDKAWNPWNTYGGKTTDISGGYNYYHPELDNPIWDLNGGKENSVNRVWRWTLDDLRAKGIDPGSASQDVVQAAWLNNVARLRRDIEAPDNAQRGLTWKGSGLAGYDRFLQNPQVPGQGAGDPANPAGNPNLPSVVINPPPNKAPGSVVIPPANPGLGGGSPVNNAAGSGGLNAATSAAIAEDPDFAYNYMIRQLGLNPEIPGYFNNFLKQKFSPLLQARLAASQVQGGGAQGGQYLDQIGGTVQGFGQGLFQQGGNFYGQLSDIARQALGGGAQSYLGGLEDQGQVKGYLDQLQTLAYAGANPLVQQSLADTITRGYDQYKWDSLMRMNQGQQGDPYLDWLRQNAKYNKYLPV